MIKLSLPIDFNRGGYRIRFEKVGEKQPKWPDTLSVQERADEIKRHCLLLQKRYYNWALRLHIRNQELVRSPTLPFMKHIQIPNAIDEWNMFVWDELFHEVKSTYPLWEKPEAGNASLLSIAALCKNDERAVILAARGPRPKWEPPAGGITPDLYIPSDVELDASWESYIPDLQSCLARIRHIHGSDVLSRYRLLRNQMSHMSEREIKPVYIHEIDFLYEETKKAVTGVLLGFLQSGINAEHFEEHQTNGATSLWGNLAWVGETPEELFEIRDERNKVHHSFTFRDFKEGVDKLKALWLLKDGHSYYLIRIHTTYSVQKKVVEKTVMFPDKPFIYGQDHATGQVDFYPDGTLDPD